MKSKIALGILRNRINDIYVFHHHSIKSSLSFSFSVFKQFNSSNKCKSISDVIIWHNRFGHTSIETIKNLSLVPSDYQYDSPCLICSKTKQCRLPFPSSQSQSKGIFDLIHINIWGRYKHTSHDGHKLFLRIVDDYNRNTWIHLLNNKCYALTLIKDFVKFVQTHFSKKIKVIRSDNAYELGSSNEGMESYSSQCIIHQKSTTYNSQHNGIVERKHKHILEVARV